MNRKRHFYRRFGAEEYYVYDPDRVILRGWGRAGRRFVPVPHMHDFVSPRLGIRFDLSGPELMIYGPGGKPFLTFAELMDAANREARRRVPLGLQGGRPVVRRGPRVPTRR